jgi:hypothetical protein
MYWEIMEDILGVKKEQLSHHTQLPSNASISFSSASLFPMHYFVITYTLYVQIYIQFIVHTSTVLSILKFSPTFTLANFTLYLTINTPLAFNGSLSLDTGLLKSEGSPIPADRLQREVTLFLEKQHFNTIFHHISIQILFSAFPPHV